MGSRNEAVDKANVALRQNLSSYEDEHPREVDVPVQEDVAGARAATAALAAWLSGRSDGSELEVTGAEPPSVPPWA